MSGKTTSARDPDQMPGYDIVPVKEFEGEGVTKGVEIFDQGAVSFEEIVKISEKHQIVTEDNRYCLQFLGGKPELLSEEQIREELHDFSDGIPEGSEIVDEDE